MQEIDADPRDTRRFVVRVSGGREDVLGGRLSRRNAYIDLYPSVLEGQPSVDDLAVHQKTKASYSLSGSRPVVYDIWRVA